MCFSKIVEIAGTHANKLPLCLQLPDVFLHHGQLLPSIYCKFGNFRVTFISRIFDFRIISEFLNSRASTCAVYKAYSNSLLARTLFSRGIEFANISEN